MPNGDTTDSGVMSRDEFYRTLRLKTAGATPTPTPAAKPTPVAKPLGDPFKRLRETAGLPTDRPAPDPGAAISKLPPYPGKPAEPAPPKPDREAADAALAKLHEEVGPSEGPPKPLPEAEISKEGLISRTAEYRRPLIDLPLSYGGWLAGAATPYPGGAAVGAGTGSTIANVINAYIDSLGGARVDLGPKAIGEDWLVNVGANVLTEGAVKYAPKGIGWTEAKQSVSEAERTYGMVMRDRQEYIARTAAEREEAAKKLEQQELEKAAPGLRTKALTEATGATPESAGQAAVADMGPVPGANIEGPTQEEIMKQKGLRGTYYRLRKRTFDSLGKMYDDLMTPLLKTKDVDGNVVPIKIAEQDRNEVVQDVRDTFNAQRGYAKETKGRYKGEVPRLLSFTKRILREDLDDEDFKNIGQAGRSLIDQQSGLSELELPPPDPNRPIAGIGPSGTSITKPAQIKPISRGDLYYMLRMARHAAATAPDAESAKAANAIAESYEKALEKSGITGDQLSKLKAIHSNYRAAILDFPWEVGDKVSEGKNLMEIGGAIFEDPQRTARIFRNATDEERGILKEQWGNWGFRNWKKVFPASAAENPAEAEQLAKAYRSIVGPDSVLAKPKGIMFTAAQLQHLEDFPKDADLLWQGVDEQLKTMATNAAKEDVKFGMTLLRKMGPVGADTARAVEAAKTPEEAATIIDEYFNKMTPGYFRKMVGEKEGIGPGTLVGKQMAIGPEPTEKSIGPYTEFMIKRRGAWPWYLMTLGAGALSGHIGPYWPVIAGGASTMAVRRALQGYMVKALVSEDAQPIVSALSNGAYKLAGTGVAKVLMYQATQHAVKYGVPIPGTDLRTPSFGDPVEPEPELNPYTLEPINPPKDDKTSMIDPKNIGPMAKEVERKQATQMASERGRQDSTHVDKIEDLHMQVASGEVPDVHRDLSSGRLSNDEVRQMLADKPRDPTAMFQGMSLADALHAFSLGTDMEKSLSLTALAQKIQNEGQNMKPEQRRAVMAQLQKALGESAA